VPAIERYDEWEASLDETLADPLAPVYDAETLEAIDGEDAGSTTTSAWRGGVVSGALLVGMVNGMREALDVGEREPEIGQFEQSFSLHEAVTVRLAWGNPAASVAIVRPWLL
jgi:hypothetical protein